MIYIIFGASGSGKSTLLNIIRDDFGVKSTHVKGTTRKKRRYDETEIISYPNGLPKDKYDYIYSQYGYEYGIEKNNCQRLLRIIKIILLFAMIQLLLKDLEVIFTVR